MGMTYFNVIVNEFGRKEFNASDLARLTGHSRPVRLLSELKLRGLVRRTGRGTYVVNRPIRKEDTRNAEWNRVRKVILKASYPKAWTGSTAVTVWTEGRYVTAPNLYLVVYDLRIREEDLERWKTYLREYGVAFAGVKRVGSWVSLESVPNVRYEMMNGEPVIPREEVVSLIREHPGIYAGAEELLAS